MGVAGVDGNGQRELAEAIAGQRPLAGATSACSATPWKLKVAQREKLGLATSPTIVSTRTVRSLSVAMNIVLKQIGKAPFWERGRIRYAAILEQARELISRFEIRTPARRASARSPAERPEGRAPRELSFDPKVVVYSKPTYGLDVKTTRSASRRFASRR